MVRDKAQAEWAFGLNSFVLFRGIYHKVQDTVRAYRVQALIKHSPLVAKNGSTLESPHSLKFGTI